jgi:lauroyl/myristoyl acyltransferase
LPKGSVLLHRVVYWIFRFIIFIGSPVPVRVGYLISPIIADICYIFYRGGRRALYENLSRVLDTTDRRVLGRFARRSLRNFSKYVVDFIHFYAMSAEDIRRRIVFDDFERLNATVDEGKGIIFVTLHFGNWDMGAAGLAAYGYPIDAIAETFELPEMNELVQGYRRELGMKIIPMERIGPGVLRALRRGEILALLIDVPAPGASVAVDFFGAVAEVPAGPARLALRTGARVIPAVLVRVPGHDELIRPVLDFDLHFEPTGDEEEDARELTQQTMWSLERFIRQYPDQWFMFRPLWPAAQPAHKARPVLAQEA